MLIDARKVTSNNCDVTKQMLRLQPSRPGAYGAIQKILQWRGRVFRERVSGGRAAFGVAAGDAVEHVAPLRAGQDCAVDEAAGGFLAVGVAFGG